MPRASQPHRSDSTGNDSDFPIVVIGAGFAGICAGIRMKQEGIESFTIFERASDVGGTWRDNTYPGCACDVPSHAYSLSFEPNPDWSHKYSPWHEIKAYLERITDKWRLREHMRFDTEIVDARFDEKTGLWSLTTNHGEVVRARWVVSCVGGLVDPAYPDIEGIHAFEGEIFHTARWNHDFDLTGRKVAVIGTGASAVQVVPSIADRVEELQVYQRTAAWVVPKRDHLYSEAERARYRRFPWLLEASRLLKYWGSELYGPIVFLDNDRLSALGEKLSLAHLRSQVKDPVLREKLTPDFQFGCKRILVSDDYWKSFERENVELVTEGIEEITRTGIRTKDGCEREVDAIILATGYALGLAAAPFPITGLGGATLDDAWKDGAEAYKGMEVAGFPNWTICMGPNTGPGHTSVLVYTEAQIDHFLKAVSHLRRRGLRWMSIQQRVQDAYNAAIRKRMKKMTWSSGCNSWYLSGDHENHALYPGWAFDYVLRARRFKPSQYDTAPLQAPGSHPAPPSRALRPAGPGDGRG
jgi:cation diffusion facilitator CzcD-associated flavoprotein CzcO